MMTLRCIIRVLLVFFLFDTLCAIRIADTTFVSKPEMQTHCSSDGEYKIVKDTNAPRRINIVGWDAMFSGWGGGPQAVRGFAEYLQLHGFQPRVLHCSDVEKKFGEAGGNIRHPLVVNPKDVFVATFLPATARKAQKYSEMVGTTPIFFTQDSEHLFGEGYEGVKELYTIPHLSIYNCLPLYRYFEVEKAVPNNVVAPGIYFQARVPQVEIQKNVLLNQQESGISKVLIYGKNLRNEGPNAVRALREAIDSGVFEKGKWEFYYIGARARDVYLGPNHVLKQLGAMSQTDYYATLPMFSLGIVLNNCASLPFATYDFALNGMTVVVNAFEGRDASYFQELSPLFEVASSYESHDVSKAIAGAVSRLHGGLDIDKRLNLAAQLREKVPTTWDESFSPINDKLKAMFERASNPEQA